MKTVSMSGSLRESVGKKDAKKHRSSGQVPCVLYGGKEQVHFTVDEKSFGTLIFTPDVYITKLEIAGKSYDTILQDVQYHPVTDQVMHADFLELQPGKAVTVALPIQLNGVAPGVLQGGRLFKKKRKLKVHGLPESIPEHIGIDINGLNVGQSIRVEDVIVPNLQMLDAIRDVVVTVATTRTTAATGTEEVAKEGKAAE